MRKTITGLGLAKWMLTPWLLVLPLIPWLPYLIPMYARKVYALLVEP